MGSLRPFIDTSAEVQRAMGFQNDDFRGSEWISTILGDDVKGRFADLKQAAADRSPRQLGTFVKAAEVQYHHEIYNQALWNLY